MLTMGGAWIRLATASVCISFHQCSRSAIKLRASGKASLMMSASQPRCSASVPSLYQSRISTGDVLRHCSRKLRNSLS
ncbi:hypothetical protein [uncultured Phascolarctobacterium sp.]|uniref:hypothetical protein n=1 Tax=uncultured Phascolarctobacterium sp. TaxID=512296 RepID=UPI00258761D3|nr:hypothetical protein [uncultured Phascolarctobacterium sp.]